MAVSVAKGNTSVCTTNAERSSVSKTSGAATDSAVKSITKNLRLTYAGVECNITNV